MAKTKQTKKQKLTKMLSFLKEGQGIELREDTFLCGKELDGSDKIYGFTKEDGELLVVSRQSNDGYPISEMDNADLNYMFNLSSVAKKIKTKQYEIVEADEV